MATVRDIAGYSDARLIGEGGFGAVYRARDESHGREVAIKVLPSELGEDERRRFERERQTMGSLGDHPFVIPVHESGFTDDGEAYIVMELASGGSLRERLRNTGPIPWAEAAKLMAAVADAVQIAHENDVLHRDIKPDNVLIDRFGNPKLADFGLAAIAGSTTSSTDTAATLAHAAPELLRGDPSTEAVDIYALGSTVYALIKDTPAFFSSDDEDITPMIERIQNDPPPDLRKVGIPDEMVTVIERAMAKDPADRYPTAGELAVALRAASAGEGPPTGPLTVAPDDLPTITREVAARKAADDNDSAERDDAADIDDDDADDEDLDDDSEDEDIDDAEDGTDDEVADDVDDGEAEPAAAVRRAGAPPLPPHRYQSNPEAEPAWTTNRIMALSFAAFAFIMTIALASFLIARGGGVSTAGADGDLASGSGGGAPAAQVDCPTTIPLGTKMVCTIYTTNAVAGSWHLPAFLPEPEPIERLPGEYDIYISPTNESAIDRTYALIVTVEGADGSTHRTTHDFLVVDVYAEVDCPDRVALNDTVTCDIVTYNATEGEWNIPSFDGAELTIAPGANPILIQASDPNSVGSRFEISVTARNASGASYEATSEFEVIAPDS